MIEDKVKLKTAIFYLAQRIQEDRKELAQLKGECWVGFEENISKDILNILCDEEEVKEYVKND